jgi:hypothetical protein
MGELEMNDDELKKDLKGSGHSIFEILPWHLPGDWKKQEKPQSGQPESRTKHLPNKSLTFGPACSVFIY